MAAAPVPGGLKLTISIGVALPTSAAEDAGALLRNADSAMYRAKHNGRARSVLFADVMRAEAMDGLGTETQPRRAITDDPMREHYHPLLDVVGGAGSG